MKANHSSLRVTTSTVFLRAAVLALAAAVLAVCLLILPRFLQSELNGDFDYGYVFIGMYITAVPFFYAVFQTLLLIRRIDNNEIFSEKSVTLVQNIKRCAWIISVFYTVELPYIFILGDRDDAPGIVFLGFVITFASWVIATAASVLQKLLQKATALQSESDLTV